MSAKRARTDPLFANAWVHVHEEDTAEGHVYRPEEDDIPLSRRPRERIQLQPDGSASISLPGADDRHVKQAATWSDDDGVVVINQRAGGKRLRVVRQSSSRLIIQPGDAA